MKNAAQVTAIAKQMTIFVIGLKAKLNDMMPGEIDDTIKVTSINRMNDFIDRIVTTAKQVEYLVINDVRRLEIEQYSLSVINSDHPFVNMLSNMAIDGIEEAASIFMDKLNGNELIDHYYKP